MELRGKRALVTGAARGIGAVIARRLALSGADVAVHYHRSAAAATEVAAECGGFTIAADLATPAGAERLADAISERWSRLDVLVNNAALTSPMTWDETDPLIWSQVLAVGLSGPFYCLRALAPRLAGGGAVVNLGSVAGLNGGSLGPAYAAAKAGLLGLTRQAARALGPRGIRVNAVCPGPVASELVAAMPAAAIATMVQATPLGRVAEPADVAEAVLFLACERSRFITGQTLVVDGGRVMH